MRAASRLALIISPEAARTNPERGFSELTRDAFVHSAGRTGREKRVPGHDIIVIGASAGGVEALKEIMRELPADIPAALFVVLHVPAQSPSILPQILDREGPLSVGHAIDGEPIKPGRVYVAPPDNHLMVGRECVRVIHGPRENRYRPAVDPLFRSAAVAYGPRVVGVVLTGALDDGTVGMIAVKKCGGLAVVQDPHDAIYSGMPSSVMRNVRVDYCVPLAEVAPLLVRLSREPAAEGVYAVDEDLRMENRIAEQEVEADDLIEAVEKLGKLSTFTCPECGGTLWELHDVDLLRFRCHVGHAFSADSLVAEQSDGLETALWSAVRALEEKMALARRMAERSRRRNFERAARGFDEKAREAQEQADIVRKLLLSARDEPKPEESSAEEEVVES
jgi:two-component system chemotaxis response regulator CheB